jgi:hypothetical protein
MRAGEMVVVIVAINISHSRTKKLLNITHISGNACHIPGNSIFDKNQGRRK